MAYNSYFPFNYQPYQAQYQPQQQSGIIWVQGVEGAKAHPVPAGGSVLLMDSEESCMYIKTADAAGMPTLRVFKYTEVTNEPQTDIYVTKEEFEKRLAEIMEAKDVKPTVQRTE